MLLIIVALDVEAKPIIEHYKLKTLQDKKFKIFKNDNIALIISGIGKINAAISTTYLASIFPSHIKAFLNIGIAGHVNLSIGQLVSIYQISKDDKKRNFLSNLIDVNLTPKPLMTVDKPQKEYESDYVFDMEGIGFFEAASKFTYVDLIYCLKIISDSKSYPIQEISKDIIGKLVCNKLVCQNLGKVNEFIIKIIELKDKLKPKSVEPPLFLKNLYLTKCEQNQINEFLWKIKALRKDFSFEHFFDVCKNKDQVFELLENLYKKLSMIL